MPTTQEVEKLKHDWYVDPCWDLETTEGFEEHRKELKEYQEKTIAKWDQIHLERMKEKSDKLGCRGNVQLAEYIESLEKRIEKLEDYARGDRNFI